MGWETGRAGPLGRVKRGPACGWAPGPLLNRLTALTSFTACTSCLPAGAEDIGLHWEQTVARGSLVLKRVTIRRSTGQLAVWCLGGGGIGEEMCRLSRGPPAGRLAESYWTPEAPGSERQSEHSLSGEIPGSQGQVSSSLQVHSDLALPICSPEAERARPRQARSAAPMEGAVQLLSREGHTVSHNSKRHYHDAFVAMSRMRQRGLLCDIVLHVAAKEIRAHKVVLASCSPYFHAMFTNEMSESRQTHVTLHDIDPQALDQLVQFAYTAEIVVGEGNVQTLLPAASLLQLNGVRDACCKFLLSQLDPSNCLGIRGFADTHSCSDLLKAAHRYVLQHFVDVAKTEEFMLLPLKQVLELVSSDSLNVPSEEDVYRAVLSWVKHDVDARRQHVPRLMKCVRLPLLSRDFLLGHVDAESLVRHHPDCKDLLIEALKFHLLPEQRGVLGTSRTRPRRCEGAGPVLFAVAGVCLPSMETVKPTTCALTAGTWWPPCPRAEPGWAWRQSGTGCTLWAVTMGLQTWPP
ncbi:kelch-like protein 17 isoform X4 [Rousettus aegyptiacus]|uniref:kelch-like protein 17 isoform X4 n=1 Tax=Rousettus aegyptiacus TaxID=9407 RepID=UPI00168D42A5|nr:kelch-like protein 17 isoform X4 [Rousettus aegyptiacus]